MGALAATLLAWASAGLLSRVLVGAGITLITSVTLVPYVTGMLGNLVGMMQGLSSDLLNILLLAGVGEGITIIGGALLFKVALNGANRIIGAAIK